MLAGVVTTNLLVYSLLPLLLLLYIRGGKSPSPLKSALILALASVFLTSAVGNPPIYTIPFLFFFVYFIFLFLSKRLTRSFLKFNLLFASFYLLFNSWWLFFYVKNLTHQIGQIKAVTDAAAVGPGSNFFDVVRLLGSWAFFAGHQGAPYFPFAQSYLNPFLMFLTFAVPALAFAGIFFRPPSPRPLINFFALSALVGIFLSHGQGTDFLGRINTFFKETIPFFWIYREPFAKFTAITSLSYAVLLGSFFAYLETRLKARPVLNLVGWVAVTLIFIVAWPLITGNHYPDKRGVLAPSRTKVPGYWFDAAEWFRGKEEQGRVLVLPDNPDWNRSGIPYAWGYDSADITPHLLSVPWIERNNGLYTQALMGDVSNVAGFAYRTIHEDYQNPQLFLKTLSLLGVSRILQRNDVDLERVGPLADNYSPERIKSILSKQESVSLEKSFGALDVYRLEGKATLGKFYVPSKSDCLSGNVRMINYPLEFSDEVGQTALFSEFGSNSGQERFNSERCSGHYIVPVEILRKGTEFVSLPYRSSFGGVEAVTFQKADRILENEVTVMGERLFLFQVYQEGIYDLYYEKFSGGGELPQSPTVSVRRLDEVGSVIEPGTAVVSPTVFLEPVNSFTLAKGIYLVSFIDPSFTNLVDNSSFEEQPWQTSLSAEPIPLSKDAFLGQRSLSLSRGQVDAYYPFPKERLRPTTYEIAFFYKVVDGPPPRFLTWENNCSANQPVWTRFDSPNDSVCLSNFSVGQALEAGRGWKEYRFDYVPSLKSQAAGLGFAFLNENLRIYPNTGETLIDSVTLRPKNFGGLVLKRDLPRSWTQVPEIAVAKRSSTQYLLNVRRAQEPFYLVFSETFNDDWQAVVKRSSGNVKITPDRHSIVNGYANSWYLSQLGDYSVEITYRPARLFKFLVGVSGLSVFSALLYLVSDRRRKGDQH